MPHATYQTHVDAPTETIWGLLLDKIEHPEKYVPGVTGARILERFDHGVVREMASDRGTVRERITVDAAARLIRFTLEDHPDFEGTVVNRIVEPPSPAASGRPILEFTLDWRPRPGIAERPGDEADAARAIELAVLQTRRLAEAGA
jgi:hypothetical protein